MTAALRSHELGYQRELHPGFRDVKRRDVATSTKEEGR
jgi:hypothetical protein